MWVCFFFKTNFDRKLVAAWLLLQVFLPFDSSASFNLTKDCKAAYAAIIDLRINKSYSIISDIKRSDPQNGILVLLENYCDFIKLFITEDRNYYKEVQKEKEVRLKLIEGNDKNSPWFLYSKAEINLQWAFVEVKFGDNMNAAIDINKAYRQLEANEKKFPGFLPTKKCRALLHTMIGNIPDNYKWAADMIGIKGSVKEGVKELKEVVNESKGEDWAWLRTEARFYLSFVQLNLDNSEQEVENTLVEFEKEKLAEPLLIYAAAGIAIHSGHSARAITILNKFSPGDGRMPFSYLHYLRGVALMNSLDTNAMNSFRIYLHEFKGINFIRTAYRDLAWCSLISGNKDEYHRYIELALVIGSTMTDEDKQSLKEAKGGEEPDPDLLRSRLLFDGGNYSLALTAVLKCEPGKFRSVRNIIEFEYRLARIHHKLGNNDDAIRYYEMTVKSGEKYPYYFAANSALQLGTIFEHLNNKEKAKFWYKKCLAMKDHEYQDSIEIKAKAGLNRVGE